MELTISSDNTYLPGRTLSSNERNRKLFISELDSPGSRKEYLRSLGQFIMYLRSEFSINELKVEREHVNAYKNHLLLNVKNSKSSINKKLAVVSSYYRFLVEKRVVGENPCQYIRRFRMANIGKSVAITRDEIELLYRSLKFETFIEIQKKTMIVLLFETGMRITSILTLKIGFIKKDCGKYILEFEQKGGTIHRVILNDLTLAYIGRYLEELQKITGEQDANGFLFLSRGGRLIETKNFSKMLKRVAARAGISSSIHPHTARVSYIKKRHGEGVDIYTIRKEVGHSSVRTTERYLG